MAHPSAEFERRLALPPSSPSLPISILCLYPHQHHCSSTMVSSIIFAHNTAASFPQRKFENPSHVVVRGDGLFPYRPEIVSGLCLCLSSRDRAAAHVLACRHQVCPRPERTYAAQIGLQEMEEQATRTAPVQHNTEAKWALDALASKAEAHFAHLRSPVAIMNCTLCRTSMAGTAVMDWVLTVTSTNAAAPYPICSPRSRPVQTSQASGSLGDSPLDSTVEVSPESPRVFMR